VKRGLLYAIALLIVAGVAVGIVWRIQQMASGVTVGASPGPGQDLNNRDEATVFIPKQAYLKDACEIPHEWAVRVVRGWVTGGPRDLDIAVVPHPPNYMGSFVNTSHSAPYDYVQEVPLVFYGPGFVEPQGNVKLDREITIADLAPTYARLMDFDDFPKRAAHPIPEVFKEGAKPPPQLIFTAVVDGGGWNDLEQWPDAWPNLKRLIAEGANVSDAIVGSSPSITPATHTNLSTGTFPKTHGVSAIAVRARNGRIVGAFSEDDGNPGYSVMDPTLNLRVTTLADLWDLSVDNKAEIGMLAAGNLQIGMVGHGQAIKGADKDIVAIRKGKRWKTKRLYYEGPGYLNGEGNGPGPFIDAVDRADGKADLKWMGHDLEGEAIDATPAFAGWENATIQRILEKENFGGDGITDLFYVNYKAPDKAGHKWNMIAPEQRDVLESVDDALGNMVQWLDDNVGPNNYLFVVTADHGQTPLEVGGWPVLRNEIVADIDRRFDKIDNGVSIIERTSASSFFSNIDEMEANDVTPEDVSSFMSRYRIGDNIPDGGQIPKGYEDRLNERIFDAVLPGRKLPKLLACTRAAANS
jgi:predicted AlkP superfamily pyrophosphatase or phosphodiesterase